ncbi:MAG TPA: hypothetical protein VL201_01025 [Patescibacteria group bacterium]|nr:hypothetical protein [Patescibacteria group bacterium]
MHSGFVVITFLIYFGLYVFLYSMILYFCNFFIHTLQVTQAKSRASYAYHATQKRFIDDCSYASDIKIKDNKLKIISANKLVTWKIQRHSLVRKEYQKQAEDSKKIIIYFCPAIHNFMPFVDKENDGCFCTGFTAYFFSCPFTIVGLISQRKDHERV